MFKKIGLTTVLSATLLFGGVTTASAASVSDQPSNPSYKTQVYFTMNGGDWQQFSGDSLESILSKYLQRNQFGWNKHYNDKPAQKENKEEPEEKPNHNQEEKPVEKPESPAPQEKPTEQPTENQTQANNQLSQYEQEVVELTNDERAKHGLAPLKADWELSRVAKEKSNDMAKNSYFSHNSPVYGSPFDMMKSYGIHYRSAGENIARGQRTPQEVVNGWMNSEGHRANILNGDFTHIGVGYVEQGNYWTQQFITK